MEHRKEDYLTIPGIQHFRLCYRQWALIHIEQQQAENVHTVIGELMHRNAHDPFLTENRKDILITRTLSVPSRMMGASGECDAVESHRSEDGMYLREHRGLYSIFPVEYKKGKPKISGEDILQLAVQTIRLEEMFFVVTSEAAVFYGETCRREVIEMTDDLRNRARDMFKEMHQYYKRHYTPKVKWNRSCNDRPLKDICPPKLGKTMPVEEYVKLALEGEE